MRCTGVITNCGWRWRSGGSPMRSPSAPSRRSRWAGSNARRGPGRRRAGEAWERHSCGEGSKGPRLYDWLRMPINHPYDERWQRWLVARRGLTSPGRPALDRLLPGVRARGDQPGHAGAGDRGALGHRVRLRGEQGGGGPGSVRGALLARLVPAHHPGDVGPCLPGGDPRPHPHISPPRPNGGRGEKGGTETEQFSGFPRRRGLWSA